ncbi:MAG: histidine kinase [Herbinix sp.]|nr:histidine kinase [Herbinix sp.]
MNKLRTLNVIMVFCVLVIMVLSGLMTVICLLFLYLIGVLPNSHLGLYLMPMISLGVSIILGTLITIIVSKKILRPMHDLIEATQIVSKGDFTVRVREIKQDNELGVLIKSFNIMAKELGGIEIFRQNFINNFSHEFKTPIVSIRGFAKQLQKESLTQEQRKEYTDIIITESERLTNMSANILLLTRFENQQIVIDRKEFYLDEQLRKCVLILEKQWSRKRIEFQLNLEETIYYTNEEMLSHVWMNLISNAIKFSYPESTIIISCRAEENKNIIVEITDHGIGINQETMGHIFDKFYQGDKSHILEGNGLGLSIVKRIVELCQGDISVKSEKEKGTTFQINLPLQR